MKWWAPALAASALLLGCPSEKSPPLEKEPPAKRTRPIGPGQPMGVEKPDMTRVQVDLALVRSEIKKHMQLEGGIPPSIGVLGVKLNRRPASFAAAHIRGSDRAASMGAEAGLVARRCSLDPERDR
jgi:hypothetical protein